MLDTLASIQNINATCWQIPHLKLGLEKYKPKCRRKMISEILKLSKNAKENIILSISFLSYKELAKIIHAFINCVYIIINVNKLMGNWKDLKMNSEVKCNLFCLNIKSDDDVDSSALNKITSMLNSINSLRKCDYQKDNDGNRWVMKNMPKNDSIKK